MALILNITPIECPLTLFVCLTAAGKVIVDELRLFPLGSYPVDRYYQGTRMVFVIGTLASVTGVGVVLLAAQRNCKSWTIFFPFTGLISGSYPVVVHGATTTGYESGSRLDPWCGVPLLAARAARG
ncbi:uncharacterized protein EI90DRAFT_3083703 [Cantharellus anzutake]|uniref:uncharacterized protein n=1 Tax=Cantharellus anzutake TaxID=1750568 RepID=UPI00190867FF|nr:uncharacterized protein EI90DRAFT_3091815 [Cantharellus anzutake]XP_038909718.1 uncharacterized protein EI90DRAFT_3083703 [Cantharellus anzutake]KAF8313552.1 hypothetical protein EI90DRAFT_3091815 [Cantharellus anzutake]KAF8318349.1 hypothetical protein EI90DRAFT_3083703 [Cantharellus anzutake]